MARSGAGPLPGGWISIFAIAIATLFACLAAPANAATGGAPTPAGSAPPPPTQSGKPDPEPSAGTVKLLGAKTWPRKSFYYGVKTPRLRYEIDSDQASNDLRIDVVNANGDVVHSFFRNDVAPRTPDRVRWDGAVAGGRPAGNGRYSFRVVPQSGGGVAGISKVATEPVSLGFRLFAWAFPVLGPHDYGQAGARFGAGRSGHSHQGQDVMARCGTVLVAARGGRVRYSGYQGAAGNYLVIDGRGTGFDTAYMHLLRPSPLKTGMTVRTGQPIGVVGETGDATACHLHFEIWTAPGWYEGGSPIDPLGFLQRWDRYS